MTQLLHNPSPEIKEELKHLRTLQRTEQTQKIFRKIRNTLRPLRGGILSKVEIPNDLAAALSTTTLGNLPVSSPNQEITDILQRICATET